jgi:hypothetical protein
MSAPPDRLSYARFSFLIALRALSLDFSEME